MGVCVKYVARELIMCFVLVFCSKYVAGFA